MAASTMNFETEPIVPEFEDFIPDDKMPSPHPNLQDRSSSSLEYLEILYKFFREDFLSALRVGVNDCRKLLQRRSCDDIEEMQQTDEQFQFGRWSRRMKSANCYKIVAIDGDQSGCHTITFSIEKMQPRVKNWSKTDRLKHASLLAISKDNFVSAWYVTVIQKNEKPPWGSKTNSVDVKFYSGQVRQVTINPDKSGKVNSDNDNVWAIEPSTFFEAYRPVLERIKFLGSQLQRQNVPIPFDRYIVNGNTDVKAPDYLTPGVIIKVDPEKPSYTQHHLRTYGITGLNLDDSQKEAIHLALTKEFALIEGPPGTGKTYVGVQVSSIWYIQSILPLVTSLVFFPP